MSERLAVECLSCGEPRVIVRAPWRLTAIDDCPSCGYSGWAPQGALSERSRMLLRRRPPERRRLYAVS